jgi:hypothetical protein
VFLVTFKRDRMGVKVVYLIQTHVIYIYMDVFDNFKVFILNTWILHYVNTSSSRQKTTIGPKLPFQPMFL